MSAVSAAQAVAPCSSSLGKLIRVCLCFLLSPHFSVGEEGCHHNTSRPDDVDGKSEEVGSAWRRVTSADPPGGRKERELLENKERDAFLFCSYK